MNDLLGGRVRTAAGRGRTAAVHEGCGQEGRRGRDVWRVEEEGHARDVEKKRWGGRAVREQGRVDARLERKK
jgi:hypothetical protein